jgi:hypothetical protein
MNGWDVVWAPDGDVALALARLTAGICTLLTGTCPAWTARRSAGPSGGPVPDTLPTVLASSLALPPNTQLTHDHFLQKPVITLTLLIAVSALTNPRPCPVRTATRPELRGRYRFPGHNVRPAGRDATRWFLHPQVRPAAPTIEAFLQLPRSAPASLPDSPCPSRPGRQWMNHKASSSPSRPFIACAVRLFVPRGRRERVLFP